MTTLTDSQISILFSAFLQAETDFNFAKDALGPYLVTFQKMNIHKVLMLPKQETVVQTSDKWLEIQHELKIIRERCSGVIYIPNDRSQTILFYTSTEIFEASKDRVAQHFALTPVQPEGEIEIFLKNCLCDASF